MTVCLLSVVRKQLLKQLIQYVNQSELLTRFWRNFKSSVWNFCRWGPHVPLSETSLAARKEERRLFSQAKSKAPSHCAFTPWSYTLAYRKGTTGKVTLSCSDYPVAPDSWQYFSWQYFSFSSLVLAFQFPFVYGTVTELKTLKKSLTENILELTAMW